MSMLVIPAIDLMDGKCVRLTMGKPETKKVYFNDPLIPLKKFIQDGAEWIHVIDLDAALNLGENMNVIKQILKESRVNVQVGGGVNLLEKAEKLISYGASRVIFGTALIEDPILIKKFSEKFGPERTAAAIDVKGDKVVIKGWRRELNLTYLDLILKVKTLNVGVLILTLIDKDGTLLGPSLDKISKTQSLLNIKFIVAGGVGSLNDIKKLAKTGVDGVIVGKALYEGKFTLKEAIEVAKNVN
ncbi:MAG: 1-(5-phosphoribosyl)-5-[(5-phosphoribosylamino)methylideneamino]imidazole-4-carboxamide isomerase [Candidatus Bathyarchaeia archaeon]